jgi:rSAM/selenodomain-associated transferase 2
VARNAALGLSVIIPTLDEQALVAGAVANAFAAGASEVIVADGGSRDATVERARAAGARIVAGARGRGLQLNTGAAVARDSVLCFLHADARLAPDAARQIASALDDPRVVGGNFRIRFGGSLHGRVLAAFYHVIRRLGVYYGDSAIFCRREAFEAAGGFPPHPIMEDLALARTLRRHGRMAYLEGPAYASPRRWEQGGIARTWASWLVIQGLWFARVPPARLAGLYRQIR